MILKVLDDMIADLESNKKINSYHHRIVFKRQKTQHSTRFYIIILFQSDENYTFKHSTLFYHENT